ncbi:DUF4900 domain-containing protein [Deinococcus puniceus]|uniref:Uncharacterized protein n=1 Tax=Deinococcus puniceus TaxID=1182568 RepID=A0A172TAT9_9DEIO|nr:DUF4900 domain-containing protein [Deinococcus puniceus]ANE44054.1 hypothetical protein SU48_10000 [Deinococcus puniceus]
MQNSPRTQGATLIVSLLMVMLVLAMTMVLTAQVTVSARRSSADQQTILQARYAAESGVSRVQSQLDLMSRLLNVSALDTAVLNSSVESDMAALCGLSSLPLFTGKANLCTFPASQGLGRVTSGVNARTQFLVRTMSEGAFDAQGIPEANASVRSQFWSELFSGQQGTPYAGGQDATYAARFGLQPLKVERTHENTYRFYFKVPDLQVRGQLGASSQNIQARAAQPEGFLLISRQPFSRYALFTNHHFSDAEDEARGERVTFTDRTMFSGPVHTNQHFLFQGTPWFGGSVSSAGCPQSGIGLVSGVPDCTRPQEPGAFFGNNTLLTPEIEFAPSNAPVVCEADAKCHAPQFGGSVTWDNKYVELPTDNQEQEEVAIERGLALNGDVSELQLRQGQVSGQLRQLISYTQNGVTTRLAYGPDNKLLIQVPDGSWQPTKRDPAGVITANPGGVAAVFNGVISVSGNVQNLNGGPAADATPPEPTIAAFAGLTLAATGNVTVTSSLTYASPPCSGGHVRNSNGTVTPAACGDLTARNMLGIYSSGDHESSPGDIELVSPASCPNGFGTCASLPANARIHAVMMASQGAVRVRGHDEPVNASPFELGNIQLLGGIIENYYGAFGITDGRGYGRNFVYDPRMNDGMAPPAFPTERHWTVGLRTEKLVNGVLASEELTGLRLRGDVVSTVAP